MLSKLRSSSLRSISPIFNQSRTAVCTNVRYVQRSFKEDPIDSYRHKLEKKAKELGVKDIEALKEKLKDTLEQKRKDFAKIDPLQELEEFERRQAVEAQEKAKLKKDGKIRDPRSPDAPEKPFKTLDSFIDTSKLDPLTIKEIELIWRARFHNKEGSLISVIPTEVFKSLYKNARENPIFVLPLPREGQGFDLHYIQWSFVGPNTIHCMFTTLLEFKTHKEFARPHTSLIFHTELNDSKGVVLMNGTVEKEASVNLAESQLLLLNIQRFYGTMAETETSKRRLQLLKDFTSGSPDFTVEKLVAEAESLDN